MEKHYEGIHSTLSIQQHPNALVVLKITGTDVGEFGDAPPQPSAGCSRSTSKPTSVYDRDARASLSNDARDVSGASIHVTAEFVRRFSSLEDIMWISNDPAIFDAALKRRLNPPD